MVAVTGRLVSWVVCGSRRCAVDVLVSCVELWLLSGGGACERSRRVGIVECVRGLGA